MTYLSRHTVIKSQDLDALRAEIASRFSPHRILLDGRGANIDAVFNVAPLSDWTFCYADYGKVDTRLEVLDHEEETFLFGAMVRGRSRLDRHGAARDLTPELGMVRDMRAPLMTAQSDFACLAAAVPIDALRRRAAALFGGSAGQDDLRFDPVLHRDDVGAQAFVRTLQHVAEELNRPAEDGPNPAVSEAWSDLLLTQALTSLRNSAALGAETAGVAQVLPYHVKRGRDYIHAHAHEHVSVDALAEYAGCSVRTLQKGFRDAFDLSPGAYLREVRLVSVYETLKCGDTHTVASALQRWGVAHPGRFAQTYRRRFGETPSETMRRRIK